MAKITSRRLSVRARVQGPITMNRVCGPGLIPCKVSSTLRDQNNFRTIVLLRERKYEQKQTRSDEEHVSTVEPGISREEYRYRTKDCQTQAASGSRSPFSRRKTMEILPNPLEAPRRAREGTYSANSGDDAVWKHAGLLLDGIPRKQAERIAY